MPQVREKDEHYSRSLKWAPDRRLHVLPRTLSEWVPEEKVEAMGPQINESISVQVEKTMIIYCLGHVCKVPRSLGIRTPHCMLKEWVAVGTAPVQPPWSPSKMYNSALVPGEVTGWDDFTVKMSKLEHFNRYLSKYFQLYLCALMTSSIGSGNR